MAGTALLALLLCSEAAAAGLDIDGIVKFGVEGDTNPSRLNGAGSEFDTVERLFAGLTASSTDIDQVVEGSVLVGAKYFNRTRDEDTLVFDGAGSFQRRLWELLGLYVRLNARNRAERGHYRDYTRASFAAGLTLRPGRFGMNAGTAVGYFLYRPDSDLSHVSVGGTAGLYYRFTESFSVSTNYSFAHRVYRQDRIVEGQAESVGLMFTPGEAREDNDHFVGLSLGYQGLFIAGLDFMWQRNTSNSFGKAFSRLTGRGSTTVGLPWGLFLTAEALIQRTSFDNEGFVDPTFRIDEENRNHVIVSLSGDFTDWLRWELRYSFYTQAFGGDDEDYKRHLVYGGITAVTRS